MKEDLPADGIVMFDTIFTHVCTKPSTENFARKTAKFSIEWGGYRPFSEFILLPSSEREKYIFPEECDTSELRCLSGLRSQGRAEYGDEVQNRLYGDIWLLEQVAEKTGVCHDLMVAFDENREMVDAIMTLAIFKSVYSNVGNFPDVIACQN